MRQHAGAPGEPLCTGSCELPPASASTLDKTTRACPLAPDAVCRFYLRHGSDLRRDRVTVLVQGGAEFPSVQMLPSLFV